MEKKRQTLLNFTQFHLALTIKILAITVATVALFAQDLIILFNDALQSETTSYMLAIPVIFTYLVYRKRKMLRATIASKQQFQSPHIKHLITMAGILACVTAVLLYWYGSYTFTPLEYHMAALPIFAAGSVLILFNWQMFRQLAFSIIFLAFLVPPPLEALYAIGATLSTVSSVAANAIANVLGVSAALSDEFANPAIIITRPDGSTMSFAVDIACSGIYSLISFSIFALFIAYVIRDKPWKKFAILLIGLPLVYLLNIVRITTLVLIGYHFGETLALEVFHLLGDWVLIFLGTLLLLLVSERILKTRIFKIQTGECPECSPKPQLQVKEDFCPKCGRIIKTKPLRLSKNDVIKIAATAICIALIISIQTPVFALSQTPASVTAQTPSGPQYTTNILPNVTGYDLVFYGRFRDFEETAKEDMALAYLYTGQSKEPLFVAIEIASSRSSLHRWETCLVTWPLEHAGRSNVNQIDLRDISLWDNPPIIGRYFVFQYLSTNETQAVLYWYESSVFNINETSQQKYVKISVEAFPGDAENLQALEDEMLDVAEEITKYWQPIKAWSHIALLLSQNGDKLLAITSTLLVAVVALAFIDRRKTRKLNYQAYQKLSAPNKQLIDAVHEAKWITKRVPYNIAEANRKVMARLKPKAFPKTLSATIEPVKTKMSNLAFLLFARTEKTPIATLDNIAATYKKISGKSIQKQRLLETLRQNEKVGLITSSVTNKQDDPIQTWDTQIKFSKKV
jgi:exosortase